MNRASNGKLIRKPRHSCLGGCHSLNNCWNGNFNHYLKKCNSNGSDSRDSVEVDKWVYHTVYLQILSKRCCFSPVAIFKDGNRIIRK